VKWEFTDSTIGFSYGLPTMVKTAKYGWTLILTSGYNNADGYGYLYFVNPATGALLEKVRTPLAAPGLAQASAFVKDYTDGMADAVYAGDLNGQLWRFDITGSGDYPSPKLLFTARDASGVAQPITSAPLTEIYPGNQKRYVLFGTGQLLDTTDIQTASGQSFYAFQDGTGTAFDTSDASPLTRGDLTLIANPATPPTIPATSKGWYIDLGDGGWRVVQTAVSNQGVVAFSAIQPLPESASQDVCSSVSGNSRVYDINFGTGQSQLDSDADPGRDGYESFSNAITELRFMRSGSTVTLMGGDSTGKIHAIQTQPVTATAPKLYNWREVPVVE
jgi:type IV pilus assembly protein PilY1